MNTVKIRNITLGNGIPKICLPIVGRTLNEITQQAKNIIANPVDIVEWRADWFEDYKDIDESNNAIDAIREIIKDIPLLYTIRTKNEGGEADIGFDEYSALLNKISANPDIDAADVEILLSSSDNIQALIGTLKKNCVVIASSHDFAKTPCRNEIIDRLKYMEKCGADVCKMAVMPNSPDDVLTLLSATNDAHTLINRPLITMSMGKWGLISRLSGELFGSSLTFGCVGNASAPGQIESDELNTVLQIIHKNGYY